MSKAGWRWAVYCTGVAMVTLGLPMAWVQVQAGRTQEAALEQVCESQERVLSSVYVSLLPVVTQSRPPTVALLQSRLQSIPELGELTWAGPDGHVEADASRGGPHSPGSLLLPTGDGGTLRAWWDERGLAQSLHVAGPLVLDTPGTVQSGVALAETGWRWEAEGPGWGLCGAVLLVGGGLCAVLFFLIGRRLQSVAPAIPANDRTTALQTDIQRLQQEVEELKKTSEGKTVFLASISHELRTPLTSIIGFADLLEDGSYGALPAPASPVVHKIKQHAEVQVRLVNELLDMARIDAGRLDLTVSPFQLGDCLESAYNTVHTQMLAKGLSFVADVPERPITLRASYHRLHQVFVNLFSNAVKFTAQGQVGVRVRLGPTAVEVDVWDTGIGMTPVQAAVIFDEFRQGDASIRKQYGGTGLGLAICRKIVALHDGRISVQSRPGQGSTFTVWLPLRDSVVQTAT